MRKKSLKETLFLKTVLLSFIILVLFSVLISYFLYSTGIKNAKAILKLRNNAIHYFISSYFLKFYDSLNILTTNKKIIYGGWLNDIERKEALKILYTLQKNDHDINYVYAGYTNKYLLINDYIPPKGYDPTIRPWYIAAIKSFPDISEGIPYKEIKTKEWLVSISKALTEDNKTITGVIAIDTAITKIKNLIEEKFGNFKTSESFILRDNGKIIFARDEKLLGLNFNELIKTNLKKKEGNFIYEKNGKKYLTYYSFIDRLKWIVLTSVCKNEIFEPIFKNILTSLIFVFIFTIFIAWYLSNSLSKEIIVPLNNLTKRMKNKFNIDNQSQEEYRYPPNEIGELAEYIDNMTSKALFKKNIELKLLNEELERLSTMDPLTNLFNRRKMNEELLMEWERANRYGRKFSVIILDVDNFKKINDTHGHPVGDTVLKELSDLLKKLLRKSDSISRWGGEEFLILCPETNLRKAKIIAEKIRITVEKHKFQDSLNVTISLGISEIIDNDETIEDVINRADKNLYIAKKTGKNKSIG